ncbi:MAG: hypothetical protein R3282_07820 [Rhodothermales bacterium]|nr:hypothetical protein [Rhodothermales bacterium]
MTKTEAIQLARSFAKKKGWPWQEPVLAQVERAFVLFGRRHWYVRTSANHRGGNVNIRIDDKTGEVFSSGFARR